MELRGVLDERLGAREAICFLRVDAVGARRDYDAIRAAAEQEPSPCAVELQLARLYAFDPPNVTALSYQAAASTAMSGWLSRNVTGIGDRVVGGIDVHATLTASDGDRIASCKPPTLMNYTDRSADEVLRTVSLSLQR